MTTYRERLEQIGADMDDEDCPTPVWRKLRAEASIIFERLRDWREQLDLDDEIP